ncbi:MAG: ArsS family sensor histidine kinase [Campylobacteraceae bacterium]|jgi:two-component system OmpR family sensor kinase|nr:ArsS family sensor histidine kinase [Campylobacteraceae bacterium]
MKYSLKLKISLLFISAFISIVMIALFSFVQISHDNKRTLARYTYLSLSNAIDKRSKTMDFDTFTNAGFTKIDNKTLTQTLIKNADFDSKNSKFPFKDIGHIKRIYKPKFVEHNREHYLLISVNDEILAFSIPTFGNNNIFIPLVFSLIALLLLALYIATLKSIRPLGILRNKIKEFSEGNNEIDCKIEGSDEIAEIANEFDGAVKKIKALSHSRQLFLRNIMHEFKTPITKGKLSTELLEDSEYKNILKKAFQRQEFLLNEFLRIEQLGTGELKMDNEEYFLRDIIDHSLDTIGENAKNIEVDIEDIKIYADFDLFATVLKNLLDNALLYGDDHKAKILTNNNQIIIKNIGKKLEFNLEKYKEPFFLQGKKQKESRGLGFGLFISIHLVELHKMKINYSHINNESIFTITI